MPDKITDSKNSASNVVSEPDTTLNTPAPNKAEPKNTNPKQDEFIIIDDSQLNLQLPSSNRLEDLKPISETILAKYKATHRGLSDSKIREYHKTLEQYLPLCTIYTYATEPPQYLIGEPSIFTQTDLFSGDGGQLSLPQRQAIINKAKALHIPEFIKSVGTITGKPTEIIYEPL